MNTKVVWLTSVTVWLWLTPVVMAAELEAEPLTEAPTQEILISEPPHSQNASDLLPLQPVATTVQPVLAPPVPPTAAESSPSLNLAIPQDAPQPQQTNFPTASFPENSPDAVTEASPLTELAENLPLDITPNLANADAVDSPELSESVEPSIQPEVSIQPELPSQNQSQSLRSVDPLEQWSTEAWLDLLEPETPDSVQPNQSQSSSELSPERDAIALSQPQAIVHRPVVQTAGNHTLPASTSDSIHEPVAQNLTPQNTTATEFEDLFGATDPSAADPLAQLTSVSQLADVQPTDWAYQALQSLVERYGVIVGYPDGTFRGERSLTRFEFAAGVNAAMDRVTELMAASSKNTVPESDLAVLKRLQADFSAELLSLRGRVDGLEARVAEIAANQFSTTVVLSGETTFALADAWGGDPPGLGETNPVFAYLAQLQLSGSFSKRDAFKLDFDAGNFASGGFAEPQALNTQMSLMGFQTDTDNTLELSGAEYRVAVGDRLVLTFKPVGFGLNSVLSSNSIFSSSTQGALSRFAAETPIFRIGSLDAGLGVDLLMTDRTRLQIAYGARDASDPEQGLFDSDHRALGVQLLARPFRTVTTGLAYVNAFAEDGFLDTFTGSTNADTSGGFLEPAAIHALSGTVQWQIVPSVILAIWGGAAVTDSLPSDAVALSSTYQFSLGFPDTFGREGDLLGVIVGQPFRLRYGLLVEREDEGSGLHYEIFYRIRVNDNIAITPGVFVVTDPGHIADNNTIVVGAIRTAFSF